MKIISLRYVKLISIEIWLLLLMIWKHSWRQRENRTIFEQRHSKKQKSYQHWTSSSGMIELRCKKMLPLEIVFITMCDHKMAKILNLWIITRKLYIRYFKRQMIWDARLENLDKKCFLRIQAFKQTQWAMHNWIQFSKEWKRKGLSKMLSDDSNQTVKRFSC